MCGICGVYGLEDKKLIKDMSNALKHRGPDDEGYFIDKNIMLGHKRLSIIDLKTGHQPIYNEDKSIVVVYNGEIYNFKELKQELEKKGHKFYTNTDTEVIVHAYEEYGTDCTTYFNGMFAFAVWDSKNKSLFLARDRIGIKPLYYAIFDNIFLFGSEIKSILEYKDIKREINLKALNEFLTYRYVPSRETAISGIYKLLPGEFLICRNKKITRKKYWDIKFNPSEHSIDFYKKNLRKLLEDSVRMRMVSDVPLGALLSGGIDSSTIVALMSKYCKEPNTFVIGFSGESDNEYKYSRMVAEKYNTNHHEITIEPSAYKSIPLITWHMDDLVADMTSLPTHYIYKEAKKYIKVILTGDGADELFGGYEQHKILNITKNFLSIAPKIIKRKTLPSLIGLLPKEASLQALSGAISKSDRNEDLYTSLTSIFHSNEKKDLYTDFFLKKINDLNSEESIHSYFSNNLKIHDQMSLVDIKNWLPNDHLLRCDRVTMAHSIEGRVPFLDYHVAEFSATIPFKLKLKGMNEKYILKQAVRDILPEEIIKRKKQRFFTPIDSWLNENIRREINKQIEESETLPVFLKKDFLKKLLNYNRNFAYKHILRHNKFLRHYYSRQIWCLFIFDIWHKLFIDGEKPEKIML